MIPNLAPNLVTRAAVSTPPGCRRRPLLLLRPRVNIAALAYLIMTTWKSFHVDPPVVPVGAPIVLHNKVHAGGWKIEDQQTGPLG